MQADLFSNESNSPIDFEIEDGGLLFYQNFIDYEESNKLLKIFSNNIEWKQDTINMFGKKIPIPRKTAWYGEPQASYVYSGIQNNPLPWTSELRILKQKIEDVCDNSFNSLLMNKYRDGNDKLSWHADDEPELDPQCAKASLSFGSQRAFSIKHRAKKGEGYRHTIELTHGSLLIMKPPMQEFWLHQVPKRPKVERERINLTFRYVSS